MGFGWLPAWRFFGDGYFGGEVTALLEAEIGVGRVFGRGLGCVVLWRAELLGGFAG